MGAINLTVAGMCLIASIGIVWQIVRLVVQLISCSWRTKPGIMHAEEVIVASSIQCIDQGIPPTVRKQESGNSSASSCDWAVEKMERSTTNGDTDCLSKIPDNVTIALVSSPIEQINEKVVVNAIESSFVIDENRTPLQKELSVVDQALKDVHDKALTQAILKATGLDPDWIVAKAPVVKSPIHAV